MDPKKCQDTFTVYVLIHVPCHLEIDENDKEQSFVIAKGESYPFQIDFDYILGTDYDANHALFGFFAEYPDSSVLENGATITNEIFREQPDTTQPANAILDGQYTARLNIPSGDAYDDFIAAFTRGRIITNPNFIGFIIYNQGVT